MTKYLALLQAALALIIMWLILYIVLDGIDGMKRLEREQVQTWFPDHVWLNLPVNKKCR